MILKKVKAIVPGTTRQTLSYLRQLFSERGIRPKNKMGQSFLIDLNLLDLIVRTAELTPEDLVLEVGSGTGSLTARLVQQAGAVVSVELDPHFALLTREILDEPGDQVVLLQVDALKNKNELNPVVIRGLLDLQQRSNTRRIKLVSNLPYAVAVPVLSNLLLTDLPVERMVATVQWEIAERLLARPGTKDFGALTVLTQSLAEVHLVRQLAPSVFWPRPQVSSAIVLIRPDPVRRAAVGDVLRLRNFLRDLYAHRRKNLRGGLVSMASADWSKTEVDQRLQELGIDGTLRAEALDLEQHLRLCGVFGEDPPATPNAARRKRETTEDTENTERKPRKNNLDRFFFPCFPCLPWSLSFVWFGGPSCSMLRLSGNGSLPCNNGCCIRCLSTSTVPAAPRFHSRWSMQWSPT